MRNKLFATLFILLFVVFAAIMLVLLRNDMVEKTPAEMHISVILYGSDNDDRWKSLDQGIRQACRELDIENPAISMASARDTEAQAGLILREIEDGAKGLLIAADDSRELSRVLEDANINVPIVYVKNAPTGESCIGADDAAMARTLAEKLAGETGRIAVVLDSPYRESVQTRYDAFMEAVQVQGLEVDTLEPPYSRDMQGTIAQALTFRQPAIDVLIALDTGTLERAADAAGITMRNTRARILGIGSSDKVVHALGQGTIDGIVFQNEYAIGYLATMELAGKMGLTKAKISGDIQYMYVDRQTMFEPDAEHLLFSIVQ